MGFLRRLFDLYDQGDGLIGGTLRSIRRNATLTFGATDHELMKQAQELKGHISDKAVVDEYERLYIERRGR